MNDIFSSSSVVLAHSMGTGTGGGIIVLLVMTLSMFGLVIFRKDARIPKGLFVSSIIPYILVLISILPCFFMPIPESIYVPCFMIVFYSNFLIMGGLGTGIGLFLAAFIIDTLIIFGIIRLILYIKSKITAKNHKAV